MAVESVQSTPARSRKKWLWFWVATSVVAVGAVVWVIIRHRAGAQPPPTAEPTTVAKFISTPQFLLLPFDKQREYAYAMRKSVNDIKTARDAGKLTQDQYEFSRVLAWMGGKLEHLREYDKLPTPEAKKRYVDKMLVHRLEKKAATPAGVVEADEARGFYTSPITKKIVATWSKRRRSEWDEFHKITHDRKPYAPTSVPATAATSKPR